MLCAATYQPGRPCQKEPLLPALVPDPVTVMLWSVERVTLDAIDRRIVHALVVEPRASFAALADAIGVPSRTVARRYRLLAEHAALRVVGRVDGSRAGWVSWYLRIRCVPGAAEAVAGALARQPDSSWVVLTSGGTEIVCGLQARTAAQRDTLLLEGLAGSRRVASLTAHQLLHDYSRPAWAQLTRELSEAERERLRPARAAGPTGPTAPTGPTGAASLDAEDELLLDLLAADGRATNASLAAATGWHESTVRRRIRELRDGGILRFDIDIDTRGYGGAVGAMLWITVEPAHLDAAGRAMSGHPEVPFVAATTGPTSLMATVVCEDTTHLHGYLTQRLAAVRGVRGADTSPMIRIIKRAGPVRPGFAQQA